jgi:DNA-binding Lrp family transcriptional regulator
MNILLTGFDEKDRLIVKGVIAHPEISNEELAKSTGLPLSTLHKRLAELLRRKCLERVIRVIDWRAVGYPLRYRIDIRVNNRELHRGASDPIGGIDSQKKLAIYIKTVLPKQYSGSVIVEDVIILLGQAADVSVLIRAKDPHVVFDFVTEGLRRLAGVEMTTTSHEAWSCTEGAL